MNTSYGFLGLYDTADIHKISNDTRKTKTKTKTERAREREGREGERERILDEVCVYISSVYRKRRLFCFRFILMSQQKAYIPRSLADMR